MQLPSKSSNIAIMAIWRIGYRIGVAGFEDSTDSSLGAYKWREVLMGGTNQRSIQLAK